MQENDIVIAIQEILTDILGQADIELTRDSSAKDYKKWDSLANVNIMMTIEREFDFKFGLGDLDSMKNIGNIVDAILKRS